MKIGVVTYFRVANYGAMLQAFSLWRFLEERGHRVVFLDKTCGNRLAFYKVLVSRRWGSFIRKLKNYVRYPMTAFAATYPKDIECADCDAFIVGSDQMWHPDGFGGCRPDIAFLGFVPAGVKRVAYAASFSVAEWTKPELMAKVGDLLHKFDAISVRERSALEIVERLSGRNDACWVADPTLLNKADFYQKIFTGMSESCGSSIFVYFLDEWCDGAAEQNAVCCLRKELNIKQVISDKDSVRGVLAFICRLCGVTAKITVPEWLGRISSANFIVTNSFHGTVFALIFHRPFIVFPLHGKQKGMNERIYSLLESVGLKDRCVEAADIISVKRLARKEIDWQLVDDNLSKIRNASINFLVEAGF